MGTGCGYIRYICGYGGCAQWVHQPGTLGTHVRYLCTISMYPCTIPCYRNILWRYSGIVWRYSDLFLERVHGRGTWVRVNGALYPRIVPTHRTNVLHTLPIACPMYRIHVPSDRTLQNTCMYFNVAGQKKPPISLLSSVPYIYIYAHKAQALQRRGFPFPNKC